MGNPFLGYDFHRPWKNFLLHTPPVGPRWLKFFTSAVSYLSGHIIDQFRSKFTNSTIVYKISHSSIIQLLVKRNLDKNNSYPYQGYQTTRRWDRHQNPSSYLMWRTWMFGTMAHNVYICNRNILIVELEQCGKLYFEILHMIYEQEQSECWAAVRRWMLTWLWHWQICNCQREIKTTQQFL